jgi:hypothetical protein
MLRLARVEVIAKAVGVLGPCFGRPSRARAERLVRKSANASRHDPSRGGWLPNRAWKNNPSYSPPSRTRETFKKLPGASASACH